MRIGFNFHSFDNHISGVEYYSLGLLNGLLEIDNQNQYTVFTNNPKLIRSFVKKRSGLVIRDCSFIKNRLHRIYWEHLQLPLLARREQLDILHCPHYICPAIKSSTAYVTTIHDTIAVDHSRWCKRTNAAYYKLLLGKSATAVPKIITVSKFSAEQISKHFNINPSKIEIIYPGIDNKIFNPDRNFERQKQLKIKYSLPKNYILYTGNIEPKKNILSLLKAFKQLRNHTAKYSLVITGQRSWKSKKVFEFIKTEFNPGEIVLTNYIDRAEMGDIYKMAKCLILPSYCEGFGFSAIEAMACKVAVAASKVGILQEISPRAYTIIDPYSVEQMAESILKLIENDREAKSQIEAGFKEAEKFSWQNCARQTLTVYHKIAEINRQNDYTKNSRKPAQLNTAIC